MKAPRFILPVCLVFACVAVALVNWYLMQRLINLRFVAEAGEGARLRREIAMKKSLIAAVARDALKAEGKGGARPDATRTNSGPPSPAPASRSLAELSADPEFRRLNAIVTQAELDQQLAALYRLWKLTPAELARYRELQLERRVAQQDVFVLAKDQGVTPADSGYQKLMDQAVGPIDAEVNLLLGPDRVASGMAFFQNTMPRATASELQQSLSATASPLTDAQAAQVAVILQQNPQTGSGMSRVATFGEDGTTISGIVPPTVSILLNNGVQFHAGATVSDAAVNAAAGALSAEQLAALRQLQQVQQSERQLGAILNQSNATASGHP